MTKISSIDNYCVDIIDRQFDRLFRQTNELASFFYQTL